LVQSLCASLRMGPDCQVLDEGIISSLRPDVTLIDSKTLAIVELENRASLMKLSRLALLSRLREPGNKSIRLVLAVKSASEDLRGIAENAGIEIVNLPKDYRLNSTAEKKSGRAMKITTEKSWRIISRLIKEQPTSIRNLSILEGVSYGWSHAVCDHLLEQGIVQREGARIVVVNPDLLINGISWERPTKRLVVKEIQTDLDDVFDGAKEITGALKDLEEDHAFTGELAGTIYTGHAVRFDRLQIYASATSLESLVNIYSNKDGRGLTLQILSPDRDIWSAVRTIDDIMVVSPAHTLLDLAGMGYGAMDLTKALLRTYASL